MAEAVMKLPIRTETNAAAMPAFNRIPTESLRNQLDRLFADFDSGFWRTPFRHLLFNYTPQGRLATEFNAPAVDVAEHDGDYEIKAELPGVDERDVEVKLVNGGLMIKGEKQHEKEEKKTDYVMSERSFGAFERFFGLPETVDVDKIAATFSKGVLTVTLPKTQAAKQQERKIAVKAT